MKDQPPIFVTWCRTQDAFHTETLEEMLKSNLENYFECTPGRSDWIVVGVANNRREATALGSELRRHKDESQKHL